jgi:hypothetical protein
VPAGFLLVFLFAWYHSTNSTLWIRNIALVSWNQVHVAMEYGLTCIFADIDADIVSIGMKTFIHFLFDILQKTSKTLTDTVKSGILRHFLKRKHLNNLKNDRGSSKGEQFL